MRGREGVREEGNKGRSMEGGRKEKEMGGYSGMEKNRQRERR